MNQSWQMDNKLGKVSRRSRSAHYLEVTCYSGNIVWIRGEKA